MSEEKKGLFALFCDHLLELTIWVHFHDPIHVRIVETEHVFTLKKNIKDEFKNKLAHCDAPYWS